MRDQLHLSAAILAQWRRPVASINSPGPPLLGNARGTNWHTAAAIKIASKVDPYFVVVSFAVALAAAGTIQSK